MVKISVSIIFFLMLSSISLTSCSDEAVPLTESGPAYHFIVAKDGSGDFTTVQAALDAVAFLKEERTYIFIKKGTYKEVVTLPENKNNISLIGEDAEEVMITFDNYASKINPETGNPYGTSGSSSVYIYGDSFYARNITFENSSGPVGQALAIYIDGDKAVFENCRFLGFQDTVYGARSRHYFKNSYIEGTTDFIFGPATAFFDNCEIFTKGGSAITAASTEPYVQFGFIFKNCSISGTGSNITTLGRPWRPYAAVAVLKSEISDCIKPEGWNNWNNPDNEETARYSEYQNTGAGADLSQRVSWMDVLTPSQSMEYTPENVFKTTYSNPVSVDNWNPLQEIADVALFLEND